MKKYNPIDDGTMLESVYRDYYDVDDLESQVCALEAQLEIVMENR